MIVDIKKHADIFKKYPYLIFDLADDIPDEDVDSVKKIYETQLLSSALPFKMPANSIDILIKFNIKSTDAISLKDKFGIEPLMKYIKSIDPKDLKNMRYMTSGVDLTGISESDFYFLNKHQMYFNYTYPEFNQTLLKSNTYDFIIRESLRHTKLDENKIELIFDYLSNGRIKEINNIASLKSKNFPYNCTIKQEVFNKAIHNIVSKKLFESITNSWFIAVIKDQLYKFKLPLIKTTDDAYIAFQIKSNATKEIIDFYKQQINLDFIIKHKLTRNSKFLKLILSPEQFEKIQKTKEVKKLLNTGNDLYLNQFRNIFNNTDYVITQEMDIC